MPVDQTLHECFRRDDKTSWIDTLGFKKRNENVWRENSKFIWFILSFFLFIFTSLYANWKENYLSSATHNANFCSHFFIISLLFFFQAKKEAIPLCFLMKKGLHFHVCISDAHSAQKSAKNEDISVLCFFFAFIRLPILPRTWSSGYNMNW